MQREIWRRGTVVHCRKVRRAESAVTREANVESRGIPQGRAAKPGEPVRGGSCVTPQAHSPSARGQVRDADAQIRDANADADVDFCPFREPSSNSCPCSDLPVGCTTNKSPPLPHTSHLTMRPACRSATGRTRYTRSLCQRASAESVSTPVPGGTYSPASTAPR